VNGEKTTRDKQRGERREASRDFYRERVSVAEGGRTKAGGRRKKGTRCLYVFSKEHNYQLTYRDILSLL